MNIQETILDLLSQNKLCKAHLLADQNQMLIKVIDDKETVVVPDHYYKIGGTA